jgi:outer membrane lipoprotein-sorting protein
MRTAIFTATGLVCCTAALGQEPDRQPGEVKAILKQAAEAMKQAKTVGYDAEYHGTEWAVNVVPAVTGRAVVGPRAEHDIDRFSCEVTIQASGSEEKSRYTAGCNGTEFYLLDQQKKTAYQDMDQAVLGSEGRNIMRVLLRDFAEPDPFADVLESGSAEMKPDAEVAGEACVVVFVKPKEGPETTWYFSKKDHLPRRVVRHYENREGEPGTTELTLTNLVVNPSFVRSPFELIVPDGYEKTDEFAP